MTRQKTIDIIANSKKYIIPIVDDGWQHNTHTDEKLIHILASGPSIAHVDIAQITKEPTIFVNGSIQLYSQFTFLQPIAYVISDARFIAHNLPLMQRYFTAQCKLFITYAVLKKIVKLAPEYFASIHHCIQLIYDVRKPIKSRNIANVIQNLLTPKGQENTAICTNQAMPEISVSTDIRQGFVEAGTVAYIATQLAYTLGYRYLFLHGLDLVNTNQPRFYEDADNQAPCKLDKAIENRIIPSFDFLSRTYQERQVNIYNGSLVSKDLFQDIIFDGQYLQKS